MSAQKTVILGRDGMGNNCTEADFQAWCDYVAARGFSVEQRARGDVQSSDYRDESYYETGRDHDDEIQSLWAEFCADVSAWPADSVNV